MHATEIEAGTAIAERPEKNGVPARTGEVSELVRLAIEEKVSVEVLERLVSLQERVTDRAAEAAMNDAIRRFQQECPQIAKTAEANIATKSGSSFKYHYAPLSEIAAVIRPILAACGLSYTWDSETDGQRVAVTCTLHHVEGAKRTATFSGPATSNSGASDIQKVGAAITYARRQSLVQVLGLVMADGDTDGAEPVEDDTAVNEEQLANLQAVFDEVRGTFNEPKFFAFFGCESLSGIPAARYAEALAILERKRRA